MNTRSHWPYSELAAQLHPLNHGLLSSSPSLIDCRAISIHQPQGTPPALNVGYPGVDPTGPLPASIDFPLMPGAESDQFKELMIANPQPQTEAELDYVRDDFVAQVIARSVPCG